MQTSEIQIVVASTLKLSATTDVAGIWTLLIKKKKKRCFDAVLFGSQCAF